MKKYFSFCLLFTVYCLLVFSSCKVNYTFSGASVSPDVKTVSIQYFRNNASLAPPTISQAFTEALKDIFTSQTNLGTVAQGGDLNFEGEIIGYATAPVAIQSNDQAALNRLTVTVSVKFTNLKDEKQNFTTTFSRYAEYSSTQSLSAVQNTLIDQVNQQLVQDIFNKAMINW
jgi:predicted oxidoreductase